MQFNYDPILLQEYGVNLSYEEYLKNAERTVIVGMSGGVDSSVSALLLKLQGHKVVGIFMKNWDEINPEGICPADQDYQDVMRVCEKLDIPYYSVNLVKEYWDKVFVEFLEEYNKGFTPNPDILCNREIKFKAFYERAKLLGADFLATGHYCQVERGELKKAVDQNKDQTYFLYAVNRDVFREVLFPIGHLPKKKVRELATRFELVTSQKKDSTGICFIGERNFKSFLSQYIKSVQGNFVDLKGRILGQHDGTCFYTLGQRKGMGVGGPGEAWFVVGKNTNRNEVVLAQGQNHPALFADSLTARDLNWIKFPRENHFRALAKVRYRQTETPCEVFLDSEEGARVIFDNPQRALTPGQSVVFYEGEFCLGGGIISSVSPSYEEMNKPLPSSILN